MSKLICKACKSTDIIEYTPGIFGDSRHRCNSCGEISFTSDFVEPTLFDSITVSPEVLAPKLVYSVIAEDICLGTKTRYYYSTITGRRYDKETEAIAATLAELKEQASDDYAGSRMEG